MIILKKLTPSLHFPSLFNYNQLLFTTCFCWYIKKNSIESCCACQSMTRVGMFFQNTWTKGCHIYKSIIIILKIINLSKNTNTLLTHLWTLNMYQHLFSTCDTWMVIRYQKSTSRLCFSWFFNCNQLLFVMCISNTLKFPWYIKQFWYIKKNINWKSCALLNVTMVRIVFQNTWTRGYHVFRFMHIVRQLLMYQKILL